MQRLAQLAMVLVLTSGCQYILGIEDKNLDDPEQDAGPDIDAPSSFVCDPVAQVGCEADEKCASVAQPGSNPPSITDCVPNGTVIEFNDCRVIGGVDDCVAGLTCTKGVCTQICGVEPGVCGPEDTCLATPQQFADQGGAVGGCDLLCDPVFQNCPQIEGCYLNEFLGEGQCRLLPPTPPVQESSCDGDALGCFLNGCDVGYGPHIPDAIGGPPTTCGFYCTPVDTFIGNTDFQGGDGESGIDCFASFGGSRPDGPGGDRQCRFLQGWANNPDISESVGLCVERITFGDCGDCDATTQTDAMNCAPGCISKSFFDSLPL